MYLGSKSASIYLCKARTVGPQGLLLCLISCSVPGPRGWLVRAKSGGSGIQLHFPWAISLCFFPFYFSSL